MPRLDFALETDDGKGGEGRDLLSWTLSPCLEWLFADGGTPFADRIRAAASAGFTQFEFWTASNKDAAAVQAAISECGLTVAAFVSEPTGRLVDPSTHEAFLDGIERSCALAKRLRAKSLIVVSGDTLPGVDRAAQLEAIASALESAAAVATGVDLVLEPLNTRVDHPGYFLDSTGQALDVIRFVGRPNVKLLYDVYHSAVMGEDPREVLEGARGLVGHVHIADAPGRHEPGTGAIDWRRSLDALSDAGYDGALGLEYRPAHDTLSSLEYIRRVAG